MERLSPQLGPKRWYYAWANSEEPAGRGPAREELRAQLRTATAAFADFIDSADRELDVACQRGRDLLRLCRKREEELMSVDRRTKELAATGVFGTPALDADELTACVHRRVELLRDLRHSVEINDPDARNLLETPAAAVPQGTQLGRTASTGIIVDDEVDASATAAAAYGEAMSKARSAIIDVARAHVASQRESAAGLAMSLAHTLIEVTRVRTEAAVRAAHAQGATSVHIISVVDAVANEMHKARQAVGLTLALCVTSADETIQDVGKRLVDVPEQMRQFAREHTAPPPRPPAPQHLLLDDGAVSQPASGRPSTARPYLEQARLQRMTQRQRREREEDGAEDLAMLAVKTEVDDLEWHPSPPPPPSVHQRKPLQPRPDPAPLDDGTADPPVPLSTAASPQSASTRASMQPARASGPNSGVATPRPSGSPTTNGQPGAAGFGNTTAAQRAVQLRAQQIKQQQQQQQQMQQQMQGRAGIARQPSTATEEDSDEEQPKRNNIFNLFGLLGGNSS